jgi:CRISPR-associated protein Cas5d
MPNQAGHPFRVLFTGEYACFTRPEMKVERVSYPIMTPSAARGALESIFWKPQFAWRIRRIDRLHPIRLLQVRRNEVELKASPDRAAIFADQVRQQRAALVLRDVAYVVHAAIVLTDRAGSGDSLAKYAAMFERRARAGQCFQRPCLGTREFAAAFRLLDPDAPDPVPEAAEDRESLGWILYDFDWSVRPPRPRFFEAHLDHGRMTVPPPDGVGLRA